MKIKGFTLIELLIVITIIGILAVAFLPTLLDAPAKSRDTARLADLQKLQKVLLNGDLEGIPYPSSTGCIDTAVSMTDYTTALGGVVPMDPNDTASIDYETGVTCTGEYYYVSEPTGYSFGLYAVVENEENANSSCEDALDGTIDPTIGANEHPCYAILVQ